MSVKELDYYDDESISVDELKYDFYDDLRSIFSDCPHAGKIHTPYKLCNDVVDKLPDLNNKDILILFNPEFYFVIHERYPKANVFMLSGSKSAFFKNFEGIKKKSLIVPQDINMLENIKMKFDVVIGNPPYQAPKKTKGKKKGTIGGDLWSKFVELSFSLCKEDGHVSLIHPNAWRKPEHKLWNFMSKKDIKYLELHSKKDGIKTFSAATRYDWYVIKNREVANPKPIIVDEMGVENRLSLNGLPFLPNYNFDNVWKILAKDGERRCEVLYNTAHHTQKKDVMLKIKSDKFIHPCIHGLRKDNNISKWYSNTKDKGFFGVPKVILTWGEFQYPIIDITGKYGMTQVVFGLKVDSQKEADNIVRAINSDKFKEIIASTKWSVFQTEWRMFKYFKKDFWKEFV